MPRWNWACQWAFSRGILLHRSTLGPLRTQELQQLPCKFSIRRKESPAASHPWSELCAQVMANFRSPGAGSLGFWRSPGFGCLFGLTSDPDLTSREVSFNIVFSWTDYGREAEVAFLVFSPHLSALSPVQPVICHGALGARIQQASQPCLAILAVVVASFIMNLVPFIVGKKVYHFFEQLQ